MSWKDRATPETTGSWKDRAILPEEDRPSPFTSAVRKGLQGATVGFMDEIAGAGEAAGRVAGIEGFGGPMNEVGLSDDGPTLDWEVLKTAYKKARDRERDMLKKDAKYNPATSAIADVTGSIISPVNKIGKGLSMAKQAAVLGGLTSAGTSEADNLKDLAIDTGMGTATGLVLGKGLDKASPYLQRGLQKGAESIGKAGTSLYKSGLKNIDQKVARYGKDPVSDLLFDRGITGSSREIFDKMNTLGDDILGERNEILKKATRQGAEVNIPKAVSKAQDYINYLRNIDNPESHQVADLLQGRVDDYMSRAAKESEPILRELPYTSAEKELIPQAPLSGYAAEGEKMSADFGGYLSDPKGPTGKYYYGPNGTDGRPLGIPDADLINNKADQILDLPRSMKSTDVLKPRVTTVLDESERIAGPTPIQTSAWKTTAANKVGDPAWQQIAKSTQGKGFDKALSGGLREATEDSVERSIGREQADLLRQKNADLGRILTSRDRQLLDAEIEGRKNNITSVDGMIAGAMNPVMLAAKKLADLSKATKARTVGGKGMVDFSKRAGEALRKSPVLESLYQKSPQAFGALADKITDKVTPSLKENEGSKPFEKSSVINKVQGTKYAQILQDASKRGDQAFGATHFILQSTDPKYREALEQDEPEQ